MMMLSNVHKIVASSSKEHASQRRASQHLYLLFLFISVLQIPPTIEDEGVYEPIKKALQEIGLAKERQI